MDGLVLVLATLTFLYDMWLTLVSLHVSIKPFKEPSYSSLTPDRF